MFKEIRQNGRSIVKVMKNGSIIWQKPNPGILPAGYIECEYLGSAAGRDSTLTYIDTGISFVYGDYIHIKSQLIGTIVDDAFAVSHYPWSGQSMAVGGSYHGNFTFGVSSTETSFITQLSVDNNVHDFELKLKNNDITQYMYYSYIDYAFLDKSYDWSKSEYGTRTNQLRLFVGYAYQQCRIYMFEMKDQSGNHKINLIPCLDNLGVPCMYDTVSKTTFYNQGTGTFGYKIKDHSVDASFVRRCLWTLNMGELYTPVDGRPDYNGGSSYMFECKYGETYDIMAMSDCNIGSSHNRFRIGTVAENPVTTNSNRLLSVEEFINDSTQTFASITISNELSKYVVVSVLSTGDYTTLETATRDISVKRVR